MKKRLKPTPRPAPTRAERAAARVARAGAPSEIWLYNKSDGENWNSDECSSREEAIARGREEYGAVDFCVGTKGANLRLDAEQAIDVDMVIENFADQLADQAGEAAAEAFEPTPGQEADLEQRLVEATQKWLRAHKLAEVNYYTIDNVQHVPAVAPTVEGAPGAVGANGTDCPGPGPQGPPPPITS